ncbi:hypothetical protein [Pseudomonas mediterranea]|uniref:SLAC1 family transporter n=1 Tax=Pseudomonas mediterranea TaxID=183795 RepID=UPI001F2801B7|nr:hypothetical protein [Pseudomonas mediterranea]
MPAAVGEALLMVAAGVWAVLIVGYAWQALRDYGAVETELLHPIQGSTPALVGVSTLLIAIAVLPYSLVLAWALAGAGLTWHIGFSLWHTGTLWKGGRNAMDMLPTLYLPTVAGNFTGAVASATSRCSTRGGWVSRSWPSGVVPI